MADFNTVDALINSIKTETTFRGNTKTRVGNALSELRDILYNTLTQKNYINVDDFGAVGNGIVDDTLAWNNAIQNSPDGSIIVGTFGKTYLVSTITIDKDITLKLTGVKIIRTGNIATNLESSLINSVIGSFYVNIIDGVLEYTGSIDDTLNGKVSGLNFNNDNVIVNGTIISGMSWCGIQSSLSVKNATFFNVESNDNGYAGIFFKGNLVNGISCRTHRNGGYNNIDGYGFVSTHQTESDNEFFTLISCHAFDNMTRGLDCHSSRGSVIIDSCHAINNGSANAKWDNAIISTARQIHCVNRFNSCQIKNCYVKSEFNTGSLINVTAEDSFTYGLKKLSINDNICDISNTNVNCYGISVQYKKTEKINISNNIINHLGNEQIYSIVIEGVPGVDGWFAKATLINNICDRGLFFRCEAPSTKKHVLTINNSTYSTVICRFNNSTEPNLIKIKNVIVSERQISVYGNNNLLGEIYIDDCNVDSILETGAFEGGIHLSNFIGEIRNTVVKNALAQGILCVGGNVGIKNCTVIGSNRGKLSVNHANIDTSGSIIDCYVDNEDVLIPNQSYGFGYRISNYDLTKIFKGNIIKISTTNFLRINLTQIGLGSNVFFDQGVVFDPANRYFKFDYTLNPNGIFRLFDEIQDISPNTTDANTVICISSFDRTLITPTSATLNTFNVNSTNLLVGDRIGIELDDASFLWTSINTIVDPNNITTVDSVPVGRSASSNVYVRRYRGYGFSRNNFPFQTEMLNISGNFGTGNNLPVGVNYVNVTNGLTSNYPANLGTSVVVKANNNRTFELFANTEGSFWMRSLHGDSVNNIWKRLQDNTNVGILSTQTIATTGKLNNLSIWSDTRLLILTGASGISGISNMSTGRELIIENRTGGDLTIFENDTDSLDANRFSFIHVIPNGACKKIIYTNNKLREIL